ncbi:MAG: hypothetical protein AAF419_03005 [Pseudomonadota bacterium]
MKQMWVSMVVFLITAPATAAEIAKNDWVEQMEIALPAAFCRSEQYFRQCYTITANECEEIAASTTRICLKKFTDQMPDLFQQPKDGTEWGTKVGECAGAAFDLSISEKRIDSALCNDVTNWQ